MQFIGVGIDFEYYSKWIPCIAYLLLLTMEYGRYTSLQTDSIYLLKPYGSDFFIDKKVSKIPIAIGNRTCKQLDFPMPKEPVPSN